ncbi:unnamed protein product [Owenia fusiformis]|uniref:Uncharacterized protein n=1 Tax=Owenia fusiformis TaxID=6347 RepID=A0A8J1TAD2_OWEFU|nr:unnamed protein product [Owenia fusiformis]
MAPIKLHADYRSQPSRAVGVMLMMNKDKIDYEFVLQAFERTPEEKAKYQKEISPFGTVPALEVEGLPTILESSAALQYLAELDGVPEHWYPKSAKGRMQVNQYISWHGPDMRKNASGYLEAYFMEPFFMKKTCPEEKLQKIKEGFEKMLDQLENYWLKDSEYLAGDEISIADLQCISELVNVEPTDIDMGKERRPKMAAYIQRVKDKLSPVYDTVFKDPMEQFAMGFKMYKESQK